jgi:esterase/lipase superfamily enzyme
MVPFCRRLAIFAIAIAIAFCCLVGLSKKGWAATAKEIVKQEIANRSLEAALDSVRMRATRHRVIAYQTVFFVTNRKLNLSSISRAETSDVAPLSSDDVFLEEPATGLAYGWAEVSYPVNRKRGVASYNKDVRSQNPYRDFLVNDYDFFSSWNDFRKSIDQSYPTSTAALYVHGFDLSFDDAAERMAQMSLDISELGVPIFFSWPSDPNRDSATRWIQRPTPYELATHNSTVSRPYVAVGISNIASLERPYRVVGHSMGADLLGNALVTSILFDHAERKKTLPPDAVVLVAPDIADQDFSTNLAPIIATVNSRVTVYCTNDRALFLSRAYNGGPRLGWCDDTGRPLPGIDVVFLIGEIADPLRHSYYLNSPKVLEDMSVTLHVLPSGVRAGSVRRINLQ